MGDLLTEAPEVQTDADEKTDLTKEDTFVWAKLAGYPFWPGQVVHASTANISSKKGHVIVKFFGTNDFAAVKTGPEFLKSYDGEKGPKRKKAPRKGLSKAIKQIERAMRGEPIDSDPEEEPKKIEKTEKIKKIAPKPKQDPKTPKKSSRSASPKIVLKKNSKRDGSPSSSRSPKHLRVESEESDLDQPLTSRPILPKKRTYNVPNGLGGRESPAKKEPRSEGSLGALANKLTSNIPPSEDRIGFIGLGIMGAPMASNLIRTGHNVSVYNRTKSKTTEFPEMGAKVYETLRQIIENCDIVFACVSDPKAAREIVFGPDGILKYVNNKKAYVDMSTVDPETAQEISTAIRAQGGRFLEAPVSGSKKPAEAGELIIMCAGDRSLYVDCYTMFEAMSKKWFFMGEVGTGAKMKLVVNAIMGAHMAALAEGMALAERCDLDQVTLLEILSLGALSSPLVTSKGSQILESNFPRQFPLAHQQKDLRLAMKLSEDVAQPLSVVSASNELFKRAVAHGHGDRDMASVYRIVNHSNLDHS